MEAVIYLARKRWWLVVLIVLADLVIALTIGDRLVRWELNYIRENW